ncbi:MAG: c-type cytochrome domain-containing protein, partial [Verrucomicrobiota bacterium]
MKRSAHPGWSVLAAMILVVALRAGASEQFERSVRPLLVERCRSCHGPDRAEGSLRLDSRGAMLTGGSTGAAVMPGDPKRSPLVRVLAAAANAASGPHRGLLTGSEVGAIEAWIAAGAPWPEARAATDPDRKALDGWAVQPLRRPPLPEGADGHESPIDAFID